MLKVCAVFDIAIEAYGQPIFVRALGEATRSFADELARSESAMSRHPTDYQLYHIGDYDESSGLLVACTPPRRLVSGADVAAA